MAGTTGGANRTVFELSNGTELIDYTLEGNTQIDAGQMIIFTDANYPGLTHIPTAITGIRSNLQQGVAGISMGRNDNSLCGCTASTRTTANSYRELTLKTSRQS